MCPSVITVYSENIDIGDVLLLVNAEMRCEGDF